MTDKHLTDALARLIGTPCWGISAGEGTGTHVVLSFGRKIPRGKVITNRHLSEDVRRFEGELELYFTCTWRLERANEIVVGCWEDNREGGPMLTGLDTLLGKTVVKCECAPP